MQRILKSVAKAAGMTLLSITAFVILYFAAAFVCSRITIDKESATGNEITIYIRSNGMHTDIVVPVRTDQVDWSKEIPYTNTSLHDTGFQYLALGWGDKGFYLQTPNWSDLKFSVAFKAAFGLSTTAIHATFYTSIREDDRNRKVTISREQYSRLIGFIQRSFRKDANGHFLNIKTKANYGNSDAFYDANGSYSLFYTCNSWANSALKESGQRCCLWTIFDTGIFSKYQN
jgi:uncharacterized protein (TIGR02117 family)